MWRSDPKDPLRDYRMTRITFGVSTSSFKANMAIKQNAIDHAQEYPLAAEVVKKSFYVDDCLSGAASRDLALKLEQQLSGLLSRGGFLLRKWNSNGPLVLQSTPEELRDSSFKPSLNPMYTKTLGLKWNVSTDQFRITITDLRTPH